MKTLLMSLISVSALFFVMSLSSCASGPRHHHCACAEKKAGCDGCKGHKAHKHEGEKCDHKHGGSDGCEVKDEPKKP